MKRTSICAGLLVVTVLICTGCADIQLKDGSRRIGDPIQGFNEAIFTVNDKLMLWVLEPVGQAWAFVLPEYARLRLDDFFDNLDMPRRALNATLQGDFKGGGVELARFGINLTVGVLGLWDPATRWGLQQREEDFGQTLAVWGAGPGAYLVIPLFGPSSIRDGLGKIPDAVLSLSIAIPGAGLVSRINSVSLHLGEYEEFKFDALDPYVAMRNAWYQHRLHVINNRDGASDAPAAP